MERGPVPGGELGGAARVARGEATRGQRLLGMIWLYLKTNEGSDISRFLVLAMNAMLFQLFLNGGDLILMTYLFIPDLYTL